MLYELYCKQCSFSGKMNAQRCRWAFTLNNYDINANYKAVFCDVHHNVKRVVFGYEEAEGNGTPHLQGYLETIRSVRLNAVRAILPAAHWTPALQSAERNYRYCIKSGRFEVVGDFTKEIVAHSRAAAGGCSIGLVIEGLLTPESRRWCRKSFRRSRSSTHNV